MSRFENGRLVVTVKVMVVILRMAGIEQNKAWYVPLASVTSIEPAADDVVGFYGPCCVVRLGEYWGTVWGSVMDVLESIAWQYERRNRFGVVNT